MSTEDIKAAERRFIEAMWNQHNLDSIDEHVAPDVVEQNPAAPGQGPGREGYRQSIAMLLSAFPDVQITIEDLVPEGDMVVERWTGKGTHQGEFMGIPPSNKQVMVEGIDIYRYAGGKRVETWRQWDRLGLLQQLDVVPAPGATNAR